MGQFYTSADLGQVNDFTAITITERVYVDGKPEYHLRHIERPELGTPYPVIVERLKELSEKLDGSKTTVIDTTGIGRPVFDMMEKARIQGMLYGITITGGQDVTREGNIYKVPKIDLISALQLAFQNGELKIARDLPHAEILVKELTNFRVKININANVQFEAVREGIHDDLVLSAAMGVWKASRHVQYSPPPPNYGNDRESPWNIGNSRDFMRNCSI